MHPLLRKKVSKIFGARSAVLIFVIIFLIYFFSSFDYCYVDVPGKGNDKGFVFSPNWSEHLHSSEEWTVYAQIQAFYQGHIWLSQYTPPPFATDSFKIGNFYYAYVEPVTAAFLFPFYALGHLLLGEGYLIRCCLIGMIVYTCLAALMVRKITFHIAQKQRIADVTALLFAFTTMAFSYSRLLYPQPIICLLMLLTIFFAFRYKKSIAQKDLFFTALFYGLTFLSFNIFVITAPFFFYFLFKRRSLPSRIELRNMVFGLLPSLFFFVIWNYSITGNPFTTLRQYIYPSLSLTFFYSTPNGILLNFEGLFGTLFSPAGILFVSPILFASLLGFFYIRPRAREESTLLASLVIVIWLFTSFASLGGAAGRDFWIGGWASISRYMYLPSAILAIFLLGVFERINVNRKILTAWIVSFAIIISFLANLSYGVRHDLMVGYSKDITIRSLLLYPYPLATWEFAILQIAILLISFIYPFYLLGERRKARSLKIN